jgi:hypothetical protein
MQRKDAIPPATLLDPDQGVTGKPIVRVNDVERTDIVFGLVYMMNERTAHVVDFIDEVGMQIKRAAMMVNSIDPRIMWLARSHPRKHMKFVPSSFQRGCEFCHMHPHATDTNRMQRFPREHRDSHLSNIRV